MDLMTHRRQIMMGASPLIEMTATGNPAVFTSKARKAYTSLKAGFLPVQSGTGDPSPTNIRPISGWTGMDVTRTGKNLFDKSLYRNLVTEYDSFDSGYCCKKIQLNPNTTYTVESTSESESSVIILMNNDSHVNGSNFLDLRKASVQHTYTTDNTGCLYIGVHQALSTDESYNTRLAECNIQIELGSTATAYEPYTGTTVSVDWTSEAGTVYGGELDVTTGELVVDRYYLSLSNASRICYHPGDVPSVWIGYENGKTANANSSTYIISNMYKAGVQTAPRLVYWGSEVDIYDERFTDEATARALLADFVCVYKLSTPITYTLTAQQIQALLGTNTVFSDANDDIEVKYLTRN